MSVAKFVTMAFYHGVELSHFDKKFVLWKQRVLWCVAET